MKSFMGEQNYFRGSTSFALQVILEVCRRALGMNYPWDTRLDVGGPCSVA